MIEEHNFHWKENFYYTFPKERKLFNVLINEISSRQIGTSYVGIKIKFIHAWAFLLNNKHGGNVN